MTAETETLAALVEKVARQLLVAVERLRNAPENPVAPLAAIEQAERGVCLVCDGKKQPPNRGLRRGQCANCYPKTLRRLKSGSLSEASLIRDGKLLPATVGGRRDGDFELDKLAKAKRSGVKKGQTATAIEKTKTTVRSGVQVKQEKLANGKQ